MHFGDGYITWVDTIKYPGIYPGLTGAFVAAARMFQS